MIIKVGAFVSPFFDCSAWLLYEQKVFALSKFQDNKKGQWEHVRYPR